MRKIILVAAALLAACSESGKVIGIDDTAVVRGTAFVDRDGDGQFNPNDPPAAGTSAALLLDATGDTIARATADAAGNFVMTRIPAGRYRLVAWRALPNDTLDVLHVDSARFSVAAGDTVSRLIRVGYPRVTAAAARALPAGRRVTVEGIALNGWTAFGDATIHLRDATGSIRSVRVAQSTVQAGDSISLFGTTGLFNGQFVLADGTARVLAAARGLPAPDSISTQRAATADGGALRDAQVRIGNATIVDTATVANSRILGVNDGSGRLEVVLEGAVPFDPAPYVPGAVFRGAGVLVPDQAGTAWRLRPRNRDEAAAEFSLSTIAQVRAAPLDQQVVLVAVAINGSGTFGDSTVHLRDATGWLRATRVTAAILAGDSVRLVGTTATRNGQRVLSVSGTTLLLRGVSVPAPDSVTTATAASAAGGVRDAAHVRAAGSITGSQTLPSGDVVLAIDDGSGRLDVVLDRDISFPGGPFVPGAILNAAGVLVPTGTGSWQLKPRTAAEAIATFPTVTVAEARGLQVGRTVFVTGIALSSWAAFGDQTVHVRDATAAIRVIQYPGGAGIFAGDSIRMLGTVSARNGQPVLIGTSHAVLQAGVGTGVPDSVSTLVASSAANGARDANQVRVGGTVSAVSTETQTGDLLVTISDGSGPLVVRLDFDLAFPTGAYAAGQQLRVRGVLVPSATGTTWELKPRERNEVVIQ